MIRLMVMVAAITALLSWGVFGTVDLYMVSAAAICSIFLAVLVGALMTGTQAVTYGIFMEPDNGGFMVARMKPTEKVTKQDKSYMIEGVIKQGGVPIDSIGMFFVNRGLVRFGLKFIVAPGPISDEYRASRAAEENNRDQKGQTLKESIDDFRKNNKEQ